MGHPIEHELNVGQCRLVQCSCGRGALTVKGKTLLLSSSEIKELTALFDQLKASKTRRAEALPEKLRELTGQNGWQDFSVPQ